MFTAVNITPLEAYPAEFTAVNYMCRTAPSSDVTRVHAGPFSERWSPT